MWWLVAADLPAPPPDNTTAYLTFFGGIVATLGLIAVAYINSRKDRSDAPSSPDPLEGGPHLSEWIERVIKLEVKHEALSEDHDQLAEAAEMTDRRVDLGEVDREKMIRFLDRRYPGWRG